MPSSPISPEAMTICACPWKISDSAVTMSHLIVAILVSLEDGNRERGTGNSESNDAFTVPCSPLPVPQALSCFLFHRLGFLEGFFDAADHVERLFRQMIAFAVDDHLEPTDRVLQRYIFTRRAGEHFGDVERLREETFDLARARHGGFVVFRQFVHAENRDDVFQFLVALQRTLHAAGDVVVF